MSRATVAMFAAFVAMMNGRHIRTPDESVSEPRRRDEKQVAAKHGSRAARGRRRYERWLQSGGRP